MVGDKGGLIVTNIARRFLPKQIETLESVNTHRYVLYSGAVRAGKTLLLANAAIRTCIKYPGAVGMLGSLTTPQLTDVVFRVFKQELNLYQDALNKKGIPIQLAKIKSSKGDMKAIFWNGSEVMFKPCDDEMKIRGLTLDFAGLDEPIDIHENFFNQLMNRISGGNVPNPYILLTTNPGSDAHWIYKYFYDNPTVDYKTIETTTYDNLLLPRYKQYIKELEENLDEDWIRRFLDGKWGAFAGQIFKNFNPNKHTGSYSNMEFKYYIGGVDWGISHPSVISTLGVTTDNSVVVVNERYIKGKPSHYVAEQIAKEHKVRNFRKVYCDPSAPDLIMQAKDLKVPIEKADRDVLGGIGKIQSLIKKDKFYVDRKHCPMTVKELLAYRRKRSKDGTYQEKPVDRDDDTVDAVRYALTAYRAFRLGHLIGYTRKALWGFDDA